MRTIIIPTTEEKKKLTGKIVEKIANMKFCDCTACGSCRCTPCKPAVEHLCTEGLLS